MNEDMGVKTININFCFPDKEVVGGIFGYDLMWDEKLASIF